MAGKAEMVQAVRDAIEASGRSARSISKAVGKHEHWLARALRTPGYGFKAEMVELLKQELGPNLRTPADGDVDVVWVKVVTEGSASLQGGAIIEQVPYEKAKLPASGAQHIAGVRARGACLEPVIEDGDIAIVDTSATANNGRIIAVMLDGALHLKGYRIRGAGHWVVSNEGELQIDPYQIVGVVVSVNKADPTFPPK